MYEVQNHCTQYPNTKAMDIKVPETHYTSKGYIVEWKASIIYKMPVYCLVEGQYGVAEAQ